MDGLQEDIGLSLNKSLSEIVLCMQDKLIGWYDLLTPAERVEVGEEKNWSIKDEIFHSMVWAGRRTKILETLERGDSWTDIDYGDFEEENRIIFEEHKNKSWEDANNLIKKSYKIILDYINRTSEETLLTIPDGQEREIWHSIAGSFVLHPMIHIWGYLTKNQDLERLTDLFGESFAERLLSVSDSKIWQAGAHYNLACICALTGAINKSVQQLEQALKLNPDLKKWASKDTDLDPIRDEPAYQGLIDSKD